jgi:hypothetical protein
MKEEGCGILGISMWSSVENAVVKTAEKVPYVTQCKC